MRRLFGELGMAARYARRLPEYLRNPLTPGDCREMLKAQLARREREFLRILEMGVFQRRRSPYRALLTWAGVEFGDVERLTQAEGVEGTLQQLYDAGVYIALDEFKGRRPLVRKGLELPLRAEDFDNPLTRAVFTGRTGGSRGIPRRLLVDLDTLTHDAACHWMFLEAFGIQERPMGVWRSVPPDNSGIKKNLHHAKLGKRVERWFTQRNPRWRGNFKYTAFLNYTLLAARLCGRPLPAPEYTPLGEAEKVARWLQQRAASGAPAHLDTMASSAVRVLHAARERRLDISGTFFRTGSEPLTPRKAALAAEAGCRIACHYSMSELGTVGIACADAAEVDEVIVLTGKVALIEGATRPGTGSTQVRPFCLTTLLTSCPKLMLNVETDDYGVAVRRRCGCPLGELGFDLHVHTIRSYEKLTSEGTNFLGSELYTLLEQVLPAAFGGSPADYQLVEEEENGLPKVSLVVSPRVGEIDQGKVASTALQFLSFRDAGNRLMANLWSEAKTLRVVRREPFASSSSKVLPLHVLPRQRS